jgi:hypothetical protein
LLYAQHGADTGQHGLLYAQHRADT